MRNSLMMMLLAAEGKVETQTQAQPPAETSEPTQTAEEKADADALKHLEEAMKNKSGEGDGESEQTEKKVDEDSNRQPSAEQEPSQETKKPEATEDGGAKTNPAPETKPPEANGEAKPEDKKPDEDSLKGLEASLDSYLKGEDFGDEEMDRFMQGVKSLVDEVKAMRSVQAELKAFVDDQNAAKLEAAIDEGFEALSDDLADVFGRGAGRKIEKAFLENREKALEKVAVLKAGYEATDKDWSLQDLIREAAMILAPELVKSVPQTRKREFITPPQKPESQNLSGDDAAFAEFSKKFRDLKKE